MRAIIPLVLVIGLLGVYSFASATHEAVDIVPDPFPSASVLFFADTGGHDDAFEDIANSLSWIDWDAAFVATGPDYDPRAWDALIEVSAEHRFLQEPNQAGESFEVMELPGFQIVYLDRRYADPERCLFSESDIEGLAQLSASALDPLVIVSDFPYWRGVETVGGSPELVLDPETLANCGGEESVSELFAALDPDSEIVFLSRGGGGVYDVESGGYRFLQLGTPEREVSAGLTFLRIGISHGEMTIGEMNQSNTHLQQPAILDSLPTYKVTADPRGLRELYNMAPFYDRQADWWGLLEDRDFSLPEVAVSIEYEGVAYEGIIRTRGSFGNHWDDIKKSWTIDIPEPGINGTIQLKLVLPDDRLYINQLFVQEINRSDVIDIIAPEITVGRMTMNGIDFGSYLIYEDFDKAFLETQGFGSDAQRAGLFYRDFFGLYDIWDDPNFITASPSRQDKSRLMPATKVPEGYDSFIQYFEPGNYRPWIASQLFTGDPHQNAQNNTRFFVDLSTGRYIMVSWDQFFAKIESVEEIYNFNPTSYLQFEILEHEEPEILAIVERMLGREQEFNEALLDITAAYLPVFSNDPYLVHSEARIQGFADDLRANFDNNIKILTEYVAVH